MAGDGMGNLRMAAMVAAVGKVDRAASAGDIAGLAGTRRPVTPPRTTRGLLLCGAGFLLGYLKPVDARG
jgi:hypothetical protein